MNNTRIDRATQVQLMDRRVINWIRTVEPTIQICAIKIIAGEGDCLLDAVSVALCGSEESRQDLERYIGIAVMNSGFLDRIYERFIVKRRSGNLELPEASCIQMHPMDSKDSLQSNNGADPLGRLTDERQLFLLANVLRRPIILLFNESANASSHGAEDLTGVYLSLLCHPDECIKTPILLAYCHHFVPLVGIKTSSDANSYIPLVTCDFCHLPIHFLKSEEEPRAMDILQRYLVLQEVPHVADNDSTIPVLVAKVNCEESAPWWPVERVNVPDADQTSGGLVDSREESAEENNLFDRLTYNPSYNSTTGMLDSQPDGEAFSRIQDFLPTRVNFRAASQPIIDDTPRILGTQTNTLISHFCQNELPKTATTGNDSAREVHNHHNTPSTEEANTSESRDVDSACDGCTDDSDEEDTCAYPNCDKPVPAQWWPFCYRHSPDSGYAPGALLDCYKKHMSDKNDSQPEKQDCDPHDQSVRQTCDTDHNNTPVIVECVQAEPTCDFNYTSGTDDSDEDDTCFYPNCDKPAEWWPYCYRHSPDSGYAPGALLDCYQKFMENKTVSEQKQATTCNEDPGNCTDTSDLDISTEMRTCDTDYNDMPNALESRLENQPDSLAQNDDEDDDACVYPGCGRSSVAWPFCYEHSPDSGLSPGALLDCSKRFQETLPATEETSQQYRRNSNLEAEPPWPP